MYAVATFLIVAVITTMFGLLSTGALIATGLPPEIASFQARSAFSGAGFTTTEAENVVNHPARRRIIATTMFVGSLGTPTLVVTVLVGLVAPGPGSTVERSLVAVSGTMAILLLLLNRPAKRLFVRLGQRYAQRRLIPALSDVPEVMFTIAGDYEVAGVKLTNEPGEVGRSLKGLEAALPGVRVLGVRRARDYFGEPPIDIDLHEDDELIIYGHRDRINAVTTANPQDL